ncbi:MAG: CHRD domain-containing protein [Bacteroidota bacterium]
MKQLFNALTKNSLFASLVLASVVFFTSCTKDDGYVATSISYSLSGNASGSQAVPASSNQNGSGTMSGTYNSSTRIMSYTTTWSNLTGAPISGGLYTGIAGQIGTSISAWSLGTGLSTSGSFSGTTTLNADQEAKLLAGQAYYILATTANASGEIRGQITASAH